MRKDKRFEFKGHDQALSAAEVVHEQFHPLRNSVPPTIDMIDSGAPKTDELIADITPDQVGAMLMKQQGVNPAELENAATGGKFPPLRLWIRPTCSPAPPMVTATSLRFLCGCSCGSLHRRSSGVRAQVRSGGRNPILRLWT